jgi:hypothetical protein
MVIADFKTGDHIKIHPACDLFMMGETHARVLSVGRKLLTIIGQRSDRKFKLHPENVLEITP